MDSNKNNIDETIEKNSTYKLKKEAKAKALEEVKDRKNLLKFLGFFVFMIIIVHNCNDDRQPKYDNSQNSVSIKPDRTIPSNFPSESEARFIAFMIIPKALPTTDYDFTNSPSFTYYPLDSVYKFVGYVDYKNTYNAPVRSKYFIELQYKGGDFDLTSSYKITKLDLE